MRARIATGLLVVVTGCADSELARGQTEQPIVNGTVDMGDPATVYLDLGGGGCSGTLVSPKTVVTAKHCLSSSMDAYFGTYANGNGTWLSSVHRQGHPTADIAMLTLEDVGPAEPFPFNHADLAAHIGEPIRIAGFGVTSENGGGSGTKRQATAALHSLDGGIMYATNDPSGTCYGDSGGPNFMTINGTEVLIGVTSFGTDACGAGLDGSVRIDTYQQWITDYIVAHDELPPTATCDADGMCATDCPDVDPDCPCADDGFCTAACPDTTTDPNCAGCEADGTCRTDCPVLDTDCCATDNACNPTCGDADADCAVDDDDDDDDNGNNGDSDGDGGCSTTGGTTASLWLAALALLLKRGRFKLLKLSRP